MPAVASKPTTLPPAGSYRIDPARTTIDLATRHMFGAGRVAAAFQLKQATLVIGNPATTTTLTAVIDAASFASGNPKRDAHVRQPKLLNVELYPEITVLTSAATLEDGRWTAPASITARGVTATATIALQAADTTSAGEVVLHAQVRVDRYAHGITSGKGLAGRWMTLTISAVALHI